MFHRPARDEQSLQNRHFVEDGITILSHCDSDMIARRGVALLRAMLDVEDKRFHTSDSTETLVLQKASMSSDIASIIQKFYRQDRDSLSGQPPPIPQTDFTIGAFGHDSWPNTTSRESTTLPSSELLLPFGVDYPEGLDDILSLATNYLN